MPDVSDSALRIKDVFAEVAWKFLAAVDVPNLASNQHEIGGLTKLSDIIGRRPRRKAAGNGIHVLWRTFDEDGALLHSQRQLVSWYDARENQPHRSAEWRLYYESQEGTCPLDGAARNDLLLVTQPGPLIADHLESAVELVCYVIPRESDLCAQVLWALGLPHKGRGFAPGDSLPEHLLISRQEVLERLEPGLATTPTDVRLVNLIETQFEAFLAGERGFPDRASLASFARKHLRTDAAVDPDTALEELIETETRAFELLERVDVLRRLEMIASDDVAAMSTVWVSVINRRKSRMGSSLEQHLEFVFERSALIFQTQVWIEGRKVDFLFPGLGSYNAFAKDGRTPVRMLAAKSTCKERWSQVLHEAPALKERHLFTLEAAIPYVQQRLMANEGLSLVVPVSILDSFVNTDWTAPRDQTGTSITHLAQFIDLIADEIGTRPREST